MNTLNHPVVFIYAGIFLLSLGLAIWRRKTFPLVETLVVTLIIGVGFTALVYWIAPRPGNIALQPEVKPAEIIFTVAYLFVTAALLIRGAPVPKSWQGQPFKKKFATLAFKLVVFVLVPLAALKLIWRASWADLGFSAGKITAQLGT